MRNLGIFCGRLRLAVATNRIDFKVKAGQVSTENFEGDGWAEFEVGQRDAAFNLDGYWMPDAADLPLDSEAWGRFGEKGDPMLLVKPEGTNIAAGDVCYMAKVAELEHELGAKVGDAARLKLAFVGDGPSVRGKLLESYSAASVATSGNGAAVYIPGGVPAGKSLFVAVVAHVSSGTLPTLALVVQSDGDDTFASPATRATLTTLSAAGSRWVEVAGPITDEYFRLVRTVGGTAPHWGYVGAAGVR